MPTPDSDILRPPQPRLGAALMLANSVRALGYLTGWAGVRVDHSTTPEPDKLLAASLTRTRGPSFQSARKDILWRRCLHDPPERHSTAPITAVLPEDWLGSTPDGSVFDTMPYVSYAASDHHPGTHRKAQVRIAAAGSLLTAVASELVAGQMWAVS